MPVDVAQLAKLDLFEAVDEEALQQLAQNIRSQTVPEGEVLFHAGDPGDSLYIVCAGAIELSTRDTAGQKIVFKNAERGDVFGELALLDAGPRTATAIAATESELIALKRNDLLLLFKRRPEAALQMLSGMGAMTRRADELLRTRVSRNANVELAEKLTLVERTADWIAWFSGSMYFLALNVAWFAVWIGLNTMPSIAEPFDPFPFGLLTMIVSLEAIVLSIFVLISQNRQVAKDRVRSDIEYEINVKAELEVAHLHEKVDRLYEQVLSRMTRMEQVIERETRETSDVA